ncbi:hypothetical protein G7046_g4726 [Stylonectria norvegica]|nr:hypothetical protein G7046_g4726 [Stylonectria norvegica]
MAPEAQSGGYDAPRSYENIDDAPVYDTPVDDAPAESSIDRTAKPKPPIHSSQGHGLKSATPSVGEGIFRGQSSDEETSYSVPDDYANLDEVAAPAPVENPQESSVYSHASLDASRSREQRRHRPAQATNTTGVKVSRLATELYTISYLILFAILGTLARLGLTALTKYPGSPVIFNTVWANFTGSLVMGFLSEDRMLFRHEWGTPTYHQQIERAKQRSRDEENGSGSGSKEPTVDLAIAKKKHLSTKKTIPLYIGLATGFCGSLTTFSSFTKDVFLALSNEMTTPGVTGTPTGRNGGYDFMAMLAVIITTVSLSLSGLFAGAHLAIALERLTPSIPFPITRRILDPLAVFVGWGCWIGAVFLAIFPPHSSWRGEVVFAIVFAPLGCLIRFYISLHLNSRFASFPLGTFTANMMGTMTLGMAWDIAHVPIGGAVGCQVLQGIEDGFCGCLTTISTWVAELSSLRRRSAWIYGLASIVVSFVLMLAIMGGLRWSDGYSELLCLP